MLVITASLVPPFVRGGTANGEGIYLSLDRWAQKQNCGEQDYSEREVGMRTEAGSKKEEPWKTASSGRQPEGFRLDAIVKRVREAKKKFYFIPKQTGLSRPHRLSSAAFGYTFCPLRLLPFSCIRQIQRPAGADPSNQSFSFCTTTTTTSTRTADGRVMLAGIS